MNLNIKQTHQLFDSFKKQAHRDVIRKPRWGLFSDTLGRWLILWCMAVLFGLVIQNKQLHYWPIVGLFIFLILFGNNVNQIQLNLLRKAYPKFDFKGIVLNNLLTHFLITFVIILVSIGISIGVSILYYYQWTDDWCLILGCIFLIFVDWILINIYRFAPYESLFHLSGTFDALHRSRRFVFRHLKSILWLDLTFIGYDIGNFFSFGFVELYYHNYKTSVMIHYFKHYHHMD